MELPSVDEVRKRIMTVEEEKIRYCLMTVYLFAGRISEVVGRKNPADDSVAGTPYVEMVAVMAKYNPFGERAGMKKVTEQEPQREILRVSKVLEQVGFNVQLLGSERYVLEKLEQLRGEDLERVREAFIKADHPRFSKFFSSGLPFGHMGDYEKKVNAATLEQLAGLIKISSFLLQTKVYLFWSRP